MTKQEFLDRLRMSLHGKISPGQVVENLQFYEDYINTEVRKGTAEEEVLAKLGDPRLLARTIVETQGGQAAEDAGDRRYGNQSSSGSRRAGSGTWYEEPDGKEGTWHESQDSSGTWYRTQEGVSGSARYESQDGSDTWYGEKEEYQPYEQPGERHLRLLSKVPVWAWLLLVLLIVVLVVSAVFSLLAAILPILLPILLVLLAVKAFRDWLS